MNKKFKLIVSAILIIAMTLSATACVQIPDPSTPPPPIITPSPTPVAPTPTPTPLVPTKPPSGGITFPDGWDKPTVRSMSVTEFNTDKTATGTIKINNVTESVTNDIFAGVLIIDKIDADGKNILINVPNATVELVGAAKATTITVTTALNTLKISGKIEATISVAGGNVNVSSTAIVENITIPDSNTTLPSISIAGGNVKILTIKAPTNVELINIVNDIAIKNDAAAVNGSKTSIAVVGSGKKVAIENSTSASLVINTAQTTESLTLKNDNGSGVKEIAGANASTSVTIDQSGSSTSALTPVSGKIAEDFLVANASTSAYIRRAIESEVSFDYGIVSSGFTFTADLDKDIIKSITATLTLANGTTVIHKANLAAEWTGTVQQANFYLSDGLLGEVKETRTWWTDAPTVPSMSRPKSVKVEIEDKLGNKISDTKNVAYFGAATTESAGTAIVDATFDADYAKYKNDLTLLKNITVSASETLTIPIGINLAVPASLTLTNNGEIVNNGTITNNGTIDNNAKFINRGTISGNGIIGGGEYVDETPSARTLSIKTIEDINAWISANQMATLLNTSSSFGHKSGTSAIILDVDKIRALAPVAGGNDVISSLETMIKDVLGKYPGYSIKVGDTVVFENNKIVETALKGVVFSLADGLFVNLSKLTQGTDNLYNFRTLNLTLTGEENDSYALAFSFKLKGEDVLKIKNLATGLANTLSMELEKNKAILKAYGINPENQASAIVITVDMPETLMNKVASMAGGTTYTELTTALNKLSVGKAFDLMSALTVKDIAPSNYADVLTSAFSTLNSNPTLINKLMSKILGTEISINNVLAINKAFAPAETGDDYQKFTNGVIAMFTDKIKETVIGSYESTEVGYYNVPVTGTVDGKNRTIVIRLHIEFPLTDKEKAEVTAAKTQISNALTSTEKQSNATIQTTPAFSLMSTINNQSPNSSSTSNTPYRLITSINEKNEITLHCSEFAQRSSLTASMAGTGAKTAFFNFFNIADLVFGYTVNGVNVSLPVNNGSGLRDKVLVEGFNGILSAAKYVMPIFNSIAEVSSGEITTGSNLSEFIGKSFDIQLNCKTASGVKFNYPMVINFGTSTGATNVSNFEEFKTALSKTSKTYSADSVKYINIVGSFDINEALEISKGVEIFIKEGVTLTVSAALTTSVYPSIVIAEGGKLIITPTTGSIAKSVAIKNDNPS